MIKDKTDLKNLLKEKEKELIKLSKQDYFDKNKLKELISRHKGIIAKMGKLLEENKEDKSMIVPANETAREIGICLYIQRNGKEDLKDLQFHHLIGREVKDLVPFHQYATQRHYFANQIIIKQKNHNHNHTTEYVITQDKIDYVLEKYFTNPLVKIIKAEIPILKQALEALKLAEQEKREQIEKLKLKVLTNWKGQNDFVDYINEIFGKDDSQEQMGRVDTSQVDSIRERKEDRAKGLPISLTSHTPDTTQNKNKEVQK